MINLTHTKINIGLKKPVKILHITDVHITKTNSKDTEENKRLMEERREVFVKEGNYPEKTPEEYLKESIALAEAEDALLICTGDAIDIQTEGNLETFLGIISDVDMMYSPGGHEHQRAIVRTMEEPYPYVEEIRPKVEKDFSKFNLYLESRVIFGLNVITVDNSLDYFHEKTLTALKAEIEKGLPMVLFFHDPIWDILLLAKEKTHENVRLTPKDYEISHKVIDLILHNPKIIATFAGHNHVDDLHFIDGKIHYSTSALFKGNARLIEIL